MGKEKKGKFDNNLEEVFKYRNFKGKEVYFIKKYQALDFLPH